MYINTTKLTSPHSIWFFGSYTDTKMWHFRYRLSFNIVTKSGFIVETLAIIMIRAQIGLKFWIKRGQNGLKNFFSKRSLLCHLSLRVYSLINIILGLHAFQHWSKCVCRHINPIPAWYWRHFFLVFFYFVRIMLNEFSSLFYD